MGYAPKVQNLATDNGGELPSNSDIGGYKIAYLMADGEWLCSDCANGKNGSEAKTSEFGLDTQWDVVDYDVHWEGPPELCAHCNKILESEYGDPHCFDREPEVENP